MLATLLMCLVPQVQDPAPGIARDLALERARQLRDLCYELHFRLEPRADEVNGSLIVTFALGDEGADRPLVVDWNGKSCDKVQVNGEAATLRPVNGHLIVPASQLQVGNN